MIISCMARIGRAFLAVFALSAICAGFATPGRAVSIEAILSDKPPKLLSEFGFFADPAAQVPAEGVIPYDLNTPLFSDHAQKHRFVYVPEGKTAAYDAAEAFEFPVGSALIKTFAFPADLEKPDEDVRLVETRVLLKHEDGWQTWAYVWNDAHTDAELKIAGAKVPLTLAGTADGQVSFTYSVPNKNQCKGCHALSGGIVPLGPKARNLNRNIAYEGGEENQLAHWSSTGILSGAPSPEDAPAVPDWRDEMAPLEARARAWLDVNCAHCHRREGPASNSGLFLTYWETDPVALGIGKRPVAAGRGSGGHEFDVDPGDPDGSILIHRVGSTEPGVMMPELGRVLEDTAAVELLRAWVSSLR